MWTQVKIGNSYILLLNTFIVKTHEISGVCMTKVNKHTKVYVHACDYCLLSKTEKNECIILYQIDLKIMPKI